MKSRNTGGILSGFLVGFAVALILVVIAFWAMSGSNSEMDEESIAQVKDRIHSEGHVVKNAGETATPAAPAAAPAAQAESTAAAAPANDMQALAQSKGCLACHSVDNKIVGPAYKDVAAKYAGDAGAADMLIAKVKNGGAGTWGDIPMPPNVAVSDEDISTLVHWILSL